MRKKIGSLLLVLRRNVFFFIISYKVAPLVFYSKLSHSFVLLGVGGRLTVPFVVAEESPPSFWIGLLRK